jgi:hypothetical protein
MGGICCCCCCPFPVHSTGKKETDEGTVYRKRVERIDYGCDGEEGRPQTRRMLCSNGGGAQMDNEWWMNGGEAKRWEDFNDKTAAAT